MLVIEIKWIIYCSSGHNQSSSFILRVASEGNARIRCDSLVGLLQSHPPCDAVLLLQLQSLVELWHLERADLLPHSTDPKHLQLILQRLAQGKLLHCPSVKWSCFSAQPLQALCRDSCFLFIVSSIFFTKGVGLKDLAIKLRAQRVNEDLLQKERAPSQGRRIPGLLWGVWPMKTKFREISTMLRIMQPFLP